MKQMDDKEYNVLRSELQMRIGKLYEHNFLIVTIIIAAWSLILGSYIDCVKDNSKLIFIIAILPMIIAVLVNFLLIQWKENFAGIASLAAYITVFYEMPSIYYGDKLMHWGSCSTLPLFSNVKNTKFSNKTFIIVALGSFVLSWLLILYPLFLDQGSITLTWQYWTVFGAEIVLTAYWGFDFIRNCTYKPLSIVLAYTFDYMTQIINNDGFPVENAEDYINKYILVPLAISKYDLKKDITIDKKKEQICKIITKHTSWNELDKILYKEETK